MEGVLFIFLFRARVQGMPALLILVAGASRWCCGDAVHSFALVDPGYTGVRMRHLSR